MLSSNLTFTQSNSTRGIFFYRMIALVNVCFSAVLIILFLFILDDVKELWWDRILCLVLSTVIYRWGFSKNVMPKKYISAVKFLFYLQIVQMVFAAGRNDFSIFYFMGLFLVQQSFAYCLRTNREAYFFVGFSLGLSLLNIYWISDIPNNHENLYAFIVAVIAGLTLMTCIVKSRFLNDMKMNQHLLKLMLAKTDMAIFLTDDTGLIIDTNMAATHLFGYIREELVGRDFQLLRKHYLTAPEVKKAYEELDKNLFWNAETILLSKNGTEVATRISVAPIMNHNRRVLVYRVIDITEMKENEQKLIEAKRKAEEAAMAKGQFLAMMSHEIRTPLNGVIATASMLSRTDLDKNQMEYIETIKRSGKNLLALINEILDYSKMENGKMDLDPQSCRLDDMLYDIVELFRSYADDKGVELVANLKLQHSGNYFTDGLKLRQVLLNLTGNALKFTEHGRVTIDVESIGFNKNIESVRYTVTDTGIGIAEDKIHLLFQSFSQVDASTHRKFGGTGLGLAISQQIVQLMGGEIEVVSTYGKGTSFTFVLNHEIIAKEDSATQQDVVIDDAKDFTQMKVLVVDDNEINRLVFKYMLDTLQIQSDFAENGQEAIDYVRQHAVDIVFMDVQMPVMDGLEATANIRALRVAQPYIVAVTANAFAEDRDKCHEAGMDGYLSKPFEMEQLISILNQYLSLESADQLPAA